MREDLRRGDVLRATRSSLLLGVAAEPGRRVAYELRSGRAVRRVSQQSGAAVVSLGERAFTGAFEATLETERLGTTSVVGLELVLDDGRRLSVRMAAGP